MEDKHGERNNDGDESGDRKGRETRRRENGERKGREEGERGVGQSRQRRRGGDE